jgi:hypothetical protein
MKETEIQIEGIALAPLADDLQGHFKVKAVEAAQICIVGWAFARYGHVALVEVRAESTVVANTVPRLRRPDVSEAFPAVDAAGTSGFEVAVEAQGSGRSSLEVQVALIDGARHTLGWINVLVAPGSHSERQS